MEFVGSPLVTVILNVVASALVSKGVIDLSNRDAFIQLLNNIIAGAVTVSIALYSIAKMVDLKKHQITHTTTLETTKKVTPDNFSQTVTTISQPDPVVVTTGADTTVSSETAQA